ncbi:ATP-binding cassette domain-containing protein [Vibrio maerlii]|uniref:ATP-binding cassette domain-containing protein n=1 Tax=Vibrio maerlii TaxID=2231648 RepID=UPI000E3E853A|nr:ATP-binding cassette domain-containing protein [Vibrio maerlii]
MPAFQANNIYFEFENGDRLLNNISCTMNQRRVGLVGRNGVGKSLLVSILTGQKLPNKGSVTIRSPISVYQQQPSELLNKNSTIAQYLGVEAVLAAIERIELGECHQELFDQVAEQWDLPDRLHKQLNSLGLPPNLHHSCSNLSGGQLARLQLWKLFNEAEGLLVLDEPSNHLDEPGKQWLIERMRHFEGEILLVSHDRALLREMGQIWQLSTLGLKQYGGNYDVYHHAFQQEVEAVERNLNHLKSQQKQLQRQAQIAQERAEQRASQGNKLRRSGSQPKILLDAMKDKATASTSNRLKNEAGRAKLLDNQRKELEKQHEKLKAQKLHLHSQSERNQSVLRVQDLQLKHGFSHPLSFSMDTQCKWHLVGRNGCGKSTLLHTLLGECEFKSGEVQRNRRLFLLDQHYQLLNGEQSILDCFRHYCPDKSEVDIRTLLAGIGLRRERVNNLVQSLSGGEKMKVAMLIASHQPEQPLLLLDEPDNHLDIESKQLLAAALRDYQGAFLLVSHDTDFVEEVGVNGELVLEE